jgi:hypothetical protein
LPVPHAIVNWPRSEAVRTLRRIDDARNAFSIHTRSDRLLEAFRDLGVDFPATDWRYRLDKRFLGEAEGEGFEPSIRLTTDNGFRDRLECGDLQGV